MCIIKKIIKELDNVYDKEKYEKIIKKYNETYVDFAIYIKYNVNKNKDKLINNEIIEKILKRHQDGFRKNIIKKYNRCIVTGTDAEYCEACHIIPYSESNNKKKFSMSNGLLMDPTIHKLFDKYDVSIDPVTSTFIVSKKLLKSNVVPMINIYNGKHINGIDNDTLGNLKKHYKKFKQINKYL